MRKIPISEFKAQCLGLLDPEVLAGEEIIVTRYGKPVAIVRAYEGRPGDQGQARPHVQYRAQDWEFHSFEGEWQ